MVAGEAGVETAAFTKILVKMQDNIIGLNDGVQAQVDAFARLGLSYSNLAGLGADEQFRIIAEALSRVKDPATKTAIALDVFGKSGSDAVNMLTGYSAAVANAAEHQRKFGIAVSDVDAQQIEAANDAMGRMTSAAEGLGNALAIRFVPAVEAVANAITDLLAASNDAELVLLFDTLSHSVASTSPFLKGFAKDLKAIGQIGAEQVLSEYVKQLEATRQEYIDGNSTQAEYATKLGEITNRIEDLVLSLTKVDGVEFSRVMTEIQRLGNAIGNAADAARGLVAAGSGVKPKGGLTLGTSPPFSFGSATAGKTIDPFFGGVTPGNPDAGGGGGGGGGGDSLQAELDAMRESFASEQELVTMQNEERLAKLAEFRDAKLLTEAEFNELEAQAKQAHEDRLAGIEAGAQQERLQAISGAFGDLSSLMQSGNDNLFKIGQAAAVAKAVIDGYSAAVSSFKYGADMGGPALGAAFAAASLAKTGVLISKIASQSSRGGSQSSAGASAAPSAGAGDSGPSTYYNVQLVGGNMFGESQIRGLIGGINQAIENGAVIKGIRAV